MATYIAQHYGDDGILAFSVNPGGIKTELQRNLPSLLNWLLGWKWHPAPMGAITQLYAATSPKLTKADSGKYFIPWAIEADADNNLNKNFALADKLWDFLEKDTAGKY